MFFLWTLFVMGDLKAYRLHQSFLDLVDNIKVWITKVSSYFLTISQTAFTFLKCRIHQAVVKWIHGDGYKNCCMVMLFYVLFIKSQELKTN